MFETDRASSESILVNEISECTVLNVV